MAMRSPGASVAVAFVVGMLTGAVTLAVWALVELGRMARDLWR